jgi:SAM-dependent methyltransferase
MSQEKFDKLIADATAQDFSGWDFSYLKERWQGDDAPWDYTEIVNSHLKSTKSMLDMGTGGGEKLSTLSPLPPDTHATEAWESNVSIAKNRLEPFGVQVHQINNDKALPFPDERFDLIINRHESFWADEVYRILKPNGRFLTQQVGGSHGLDLNLWLTGEMPKWTWSRSKAHYWLECAGFKIMKSDESFGEMRFLDIGAVVYYAKVIPWQIPDFDAEKYRSQLWKIHQQIERDGFLPVGIQYFWLEATKS